MSLAVGTNAYKVAQAMGHANRANTPGKNAQTEPAGCLGTTLKQAAQIAGTAAGVAGAAKLAGALISATA